MRYDDASSRRDTLAARIRRHVRRRFIVGVTIMEVITAMSVLGVGATGIIAMQKTTLIANTRARNLGAANQIASTWMSRLRSDGAAWVRSPTGLSTLSQTKWLKRALSAPDKWFRPDPDTAAKISAMADVRGVDTTKNSDTAFCTHVRLRQMLPNLVRAEVRVFWLRNGGGGTLNGKALCASDSGYINNVGQATTNYHFVYVTSAVMRNDSSG